MAEVVAVFDCGSNSTRLLVANERQETLSREMTITRLSQGVDASGSLLPEAMERTFLTLRGYQRVCDEHGATKGLLVATSAVRDAKNGREFLKHASEIVGFDARILSGEEEATYSYVGATTSLPLVSMATMIVDIGGGSTELAVRIDGTLVSHSMQLGCVRVTERTLGRGVVNDESALATKSMITSEIDRAFRVEPRFSEVVGKVRLVGLAGTVATLAQLDAGISAYDRDAVHLRVLSREAVGHWRDVLAGETPEERLLRPGMVSGREDVLPAGLFVLDAVMERFGVEELLSSENDILDGIASSLLAS